MAKQSFAAKRILLVHAHPDDESLQSAHIMADAINRGAEVFLLTLTRGERGKAKLEELKSLEANRAAMGAFRSNELKNALATLGVTNFKFAGTRSYLDSGMRISNFGQPTTPPNLDLLSLSAVSTAVISDDIYQVMKEFKPDAIITYNAQGGYGHPDHKKAHDSTAMALRRYRKKVKGKKPFFYVIAEPGERSTFAIGGTNTAELKKAALQAHASQVTIHRDTYSVADGIEFRFDGPERIRAASPNFLPWFKPAIRALFGLPLGLVLGWAGAYVHGILGDNPTHSQLGLYLALGATASIAFYLRTWRNSRGALYLLNLGLSIAIWWLSRNETFGAFIENNKYGNRYVMFSLLICAVAAIFPKIELAKWRARSRRTHL
jgi:N-acetyl-1-D-myo-inositol-2-amino-2-deoxy-alpha-D-glucopyranoside deacetylase